MIISCKPETWVSLYITPVGGGIATFYILYAVKLQQKKFATSVAVNNVRMSERAAYGLA